MSLHSPNQYVGLGKKLTSQGGYCPTTLSPPGEAWCFGVSGSGAFPEDPTEMYINYAMKCAPRGTHLAPARGQLARGHLARGHLPPRRRSRDRAPCAQVGPRRRGLLDE